MIAFIDMLILAILLVIFSPVILLYRLLTGDKYMPPRDNPAIGSDSASILPHLIRQKSVQSRQLGEFAEWRPHKLDVLENRIH